MRIPITSYAGLPLACAVGGAYRLYKAATFTENLWRVQHLGETCHPLDPVADPASSR